jgi:molybdopterin synthase sulfur carrier subunit
MLNEVGQAFQPDCQAGKPDLRFQKYHPMATVWIPSLLRGLTGGRENVAVAGSTVHLLIEQIDALYPGFRARVTDGDTLRPGLAVVVDGQVATLGLMQPVKHHSEVHFLPAIGGGSQSCA